ncbi:MAG: endonuclease III domain-containing protein [Promethearchaeota archaeon]
MFSKKINDFFTYLWKINEYLIINNNNLIKTTFSAMHIKYKEILDKIEKKLDGEALLGDLAKQQSNPFKILIATILSARTRDSTAEKIAEKLFKKYNTPKSIAELDIDKLESIIRQSGYFRQKAKRIKEVSIIIHEKYKDQVPRSFEKLVALPGVGPKTANCVLVFAFDIPALTVDTHMHRVPNRLGWVKTKTPEKTEDALKKILPKNMWLQASKTLVRFGQQLCIPVYPKCNICPVENACEKDFSMEEEMRNKRKEAAKRKLTREKKQAKR